MDDEKVAAARSAAIPSSSSAALTLTVIALPAVVSPPLPLPPPAPAPAPPQPSSSSSPQKELKEGAAKLQSPSSHEAALPAGGRCGVVGPRIRFTVELKPDETTIVSWKRLLKESGKGSGSPARTSASDAPAAPGAEEARPSGVPFQKEPEDAVPPSSRFSAVIEKIERLYMGKHSSDEEDLGDIPDDDQYDTEDSFIDDAELDEYFQVDKLSTKHDGYFVNKGKLEHVEPSSLPKEAPKKRRRKDPTKLHGEYGHKLVCNESVDAVMQTKDTVRGAPLVGRKVSSHGYGEHCDEEGKKLKQRATSTMGMQRKRSSDFSIKSELPSVMRETSKDVQLQSVESKDFNKHKDEVLASRDISYKSSGPSSSLKTTHQGSHFKSRVESQPRKMQNGESGNSPTNVKRKEKYRAGDFLGMNSATPAYSMQSSQTSTELKEGSSIRHKGTRLERAIRDLEKIVAGCRPHTLDVQDVDPAFQGVRRRLPQEVKQKLAKVARLSVSQGKISEELIDRLMGILGHLVQRRTLKKNMKEMVELGVSAKQQKADRFQQIKGEVNQMIKQRVSQQKNKLAEQQGGSADGFREGMSNDKAALKGRYTMDTILEDKISDLYDLYVEGMDEDKGPLSRKLYVELAELWPSGYMDNVGIKDAIVRSKERKKELDRHNKVRDEERIKRKKLAAMRVDETKPVAQVRAVQEKLSVDNKGQTVGPSDKPSSTQVTTGNILVDPTASSNSTHHGSKNPDKVRGNVNTVPEEAGKPLDDVKKKRKSDLNLEKANVHSEKMPSQHLGEKHKVPKYSEDSSINQLAKSNLELAGEQPI